MVWCVEIAEKYVFVVIFDTNYAQSLDSLHGHRRSFHGSAVPVFHRSRAAVYRSARMDAQGRSESETNKHYVMYLNAC